MRLELGPADPPTSPLAGWMLAPKRLSDHRPAENLWRGRPGSVMLSRLMFPHRVRVVLDFIASMPIGNQLREMGIPPLLFVYRTV